MKMNKVCVRHDDNLPPGLRAMQGSDIHGLRLSAIGDWRFEDEDEDEDEDEAGATDNLTPDTDTDTET